MKRASQVAKTTLSDSSTHLGATLCAGVIWATLGGLKHTFRTAARPKMLHSLRLSAILCEELVRFVYRIIARHAPGEETDDALLRWSQDPQACLPTLAAGIDLSLPKKVLTVL